MQDAVRPDEQLAREVYIKGYQTWSTLHDSLSSKTFLPAVHLQQLLTAFPNCPAFPNNLEVDNPYRNVAIAKGTATWLTSDDTEHLPSFQSETLFYIASHAPTKVILTTDTRQSAATLPDIFGDQSPHIPILLQAWAYILSARWAELIPGAELFQHDTSELNKPVGDSTLNAKIPITISIGKVSQEAARWWTSILSVGGWTAIIKCRDGSTLYSPWSAVLEPELSLRISADIESSSSVSHTTATSFAAACQYLADYCKSHSISNDLSLAGLSAALLIPTVNFNHRPIKLAIPEIADKAKSQASKPPSALKFRMPDTPQLDRLLTLSCHARGVKSLLASVFFEPEVCCNVVGKWLDGSFAFLNRVKDPHLLLRILIERDPGLGFLWIGSFITGAYHQTLREGRAGWWIIDLEAAAWTNTLVSFIQLPVPRLQHTTQSISRANECRLLFLCHGMSYTIPPLFPFPPFGSSALVDTNLEVHEHSLCGEAHGLRYGYFTWRCTDGLEVEQRFETTFIEPRSKNGRQSSQEPDIDVDYDDDYDSDDETSAMITRNMFTYLRGEDGFPVAERAIREHEWIDNLDSDDDTPIDGDVRSTAGGQLHGWLQKIATHRSHSL
ncbi:immunoglobulin variable region used by the ITC63B heavy chain [Fusarium heterosporum]|uniref:Immunoglobulin variable region used by the ITC63B heavy chain n=1 Tax=Fusarium heterosporum TaxID=42747 RepID=A0A8H5WTJ6_FUSHE|nr:immunoglobulin variable region used by the ITC63B heavy chain [Fusarium heterosporum]